MSTEELHIEKLLRRLSPYDLTQWERVLIGHTGTVQLLLSLFFGHPVDAVVQEQREADVAILRRTNLVVSSLDIIACRAHSYIPIEQNSGEILQMIKDGKLGLGQIISSLELTTKRQIRDIRVMDDTVERTYEMTGPNYYFQITESFPRGLFRLWDLYWNRGLTLEAIAYESGDNSGNIWYKMSKYNIPTRPRQPFRPPSELGGNESFWRWQAGFFDGEGTFLIQYALKKNGQPRFYPRIILSNNDKDTLDMVQSTTNVGKVRKRSRMHHLGYVWVIERFNDAEAVAKAMLEYLVTRRASAEIFMEGCKIIKQGVTEENLDRLLIIRDALSLRVHPIKYKNADVVKCELTRSGWLK